MKLLFLTLTAIFSFGTIFGANTQSEQQISVRVGKQKKETRSKITLKFVSVVEDSRCPEGVNCVWAGNAKIKVAVIENGREVKTVELNTNLGAKGDTHEGYAFYLKELTPTPNAKSKIGANDYTATFTVSRLSR